MKTRHRMVWLRPVKRDDTVAEALASVAILVLVFLGFGWPLLALMF